MQSTLDRFMSKVKVDDFTGCWEWQRYKNSNGYGVTKHNGKTVMAHRAFYEMYNGGIPEGLIILHACDNPSCVNPDHLTTGTRSDNMIDMVSKKRQRNQTLDVESVKIIKGFLARRSLSSTGRMEYGASRFIADWFGVSRETVTQIISGRIWFHVK